MALTRGIFIRKDGKNVPSPAGTDPRAARKALAGLVAKGSDGAPRAGVFPQGQAQIVVGSAAGMSYQVREFEGALAREGSDGVVLYTNDAPVSVSTAPAPATGSRWDLIYVHYPESTSETTSSKPVLGCRPGTPSGTPTKPTSLLPAGAYVLAEALVPAGVSNTLGASIIQAWRYTAARGAPIPVRSLAELSEVQPYAGMRAARLDLGGAVFTYDGTHWLRGIQHAEWTARTNPIASRLWGPGPLSKDAGRCYGDDGLESPGDDLIRLPEVGLYAIHATLRLSGKAWGETWGALRTENENIGALEEFANVDIPSGNAAGVVSVPNFFAWQPMTLRLRFRTDASGLTLDSRVRVSRLG